MIVDRQGRRFRNLRVSLTSACNYACTYCVPDGKRLVAAQDIILRPGAVVDGPGISSFADLGDRFTDDGELEPSNYTRDGTPISI